MNFLFLDTLGYESALRLSGHHYARLLAKQGHRVLSLSAPVSPLHRLARSGRETIERRFENHRKGFVPAPGGVHHYVPWTAMPVRNRRPMDRPWWLRASARFYMPDVLRRLERMNFAPDVVSLQNLTFYPLARYFCASDGERGFGGERAVLQYRMTDLMDAFSDIPASLLYYEERALDEADLVSITSRSFAVKLEGGNEAKAVYAPNGVDVEHFEAARPKPEIYERIDKPIAVYVGALRDWLDWELVERASRELADVHFVIVSPDRPREFVLERANCTYVPGVVYEDVPAYYQHAAVGIIPFRDTPLVAPVNPIKLFECLAAGTPVVAVAWEELRKMQAPIGLAADAEGFIEGIRKAVREGCPSADEVREFLAGHSWQANLEELLRRIEEVRAARAQ